MGYDANNPAHVAHVKERDRLETKELARATREALKTYEGRRLCWWVLQQARVFASVYHDNAMRMAGLAAQQELGRTVQAHLTRASEEHYDLMAREARARVKNEAALDLAVFGPEDDDADSYRAQHAPA